MSEPTAGGAPPDWERVLSAAARFQGLRHVAFRGPYNNLEARWHDWGAIQTACTHASIVIFDHACGLEDL